MTSFRTELHLTRARWSIDHRQSVFTTGSCFANNLGKWLCDNKFQCMANPFGTSYNPLSIHNALLHAILSQPANSSGMLTRSGLYFHFDFHSSLHADSEQELHEKAKKILSNAGVFLQTAKVLMITYGSAYIYQHEATRQVVANCHKLPQHYFLKKLLTVEEIVSSFEHLHQQIKHHNNELQLILTVSPVRHLKDTLPLNQVSKSILRVACHEIVNRFKDVVYFPAYELMMDDLRDYRFYDRDLIHPNELAIDYICTKFGDEYFSERTLQLMNQWQSVKRALQHRALQPESGEHRQFLHQTLDRLKALSTQLDVAQEILTLEEQLKTPS
jgi:transcription termination factor NusB